MIELMKLVREPPVCLPVVKRHNWLTVDYYGKPALPSPGPYAFCNACGQPNQQLAPLVYHHQLYRAHNLVGLNPEHIGLENMNDLVILCHSCHGEIHDFDRHHGHGDITYEGFRFTFAPYDRYHRGYNGRLYVITQVYMHWRRQKARLPVGNLCPLPMPNTLARQYLWGVGVAVKSGVVPISMGGSCYGD